MKPQERKKPPAPLPRFDREQIKKNAEARRQLEARRDRAKEDVWRV